MNSDSTKSTASTVPPGQAVPGPNRQSWFTHSLAWIILALSLTASVGGWFIAHKHDELTARKQFEEEANRIQMALSERMGIYQNVLHGGLGLFAASFSVERAEWKAYVNAVSVNERFPGIDGLGFIADVPRARLEDFLKTTRADQAPDFQLKDTGTNHDLFIVKYFEPEATHLALLGEDIGAAPSLRTMAEKARDSGQLVVSGRMDFLGQNDQSQNGFLMLLPVFRNGTPTDTLDERRANIVGWVYARFVLSQMLAGFLRDQGSLLRFEIVDRVAHGRDSLIFDSSPLSEAETETPRFANEQVLPVGQRAWLVQYSSRPAFNKSIERDPEWLAGLGGGIFSLLIFGIALSLTTMRARALTMADEMTAAFREANVKLQKEIEERQRGDRRTAMQHAVTRVLADAETLAEATPKIIEAVCESVGWDLGAIWRVDPQTHLLHCVELWQRPGLNAAAFEAETRKLTYKPGQGLPGRVWANPLPIWIADVAREPNLPRATSATATGLHAAFAFPILMGEHFLGVIEFFSASVVEPDNDVLHAAAALGSQIGQFIERKRVQEDLRHEKFLLRTLMEFLPDRIYFKDRQSRFLRNSRAHLQRFGLKWASQAMGKTDFDFFTEEHARQAFEDEQRLIQHGGSVTKEEKETWPDGSVSWALSTKMPLRDEDGNIVGTFGISHDITARKEAEEAMRDARDVAEEANRTKSQFLANMSHELRTPLNSVIGFAGVLLKNRAGNLKPSDLNFLERIQANGTHLLTLINQILDLSKIEARKVEMQTSTVALDALIRDTIAQQEGLVRDRAVQLVAAIPARLAPIETDPEKLRQIVINLIGNALKFTEQGSVTVRVVTNAQDQPTRIDVVDTGIGIPKEKLGLIFEAFQQADATTARKYGGTGLGLTISQALCRLMGYRIEVTSDVGHGSTFSVLLGVRGAPSEVGLPKPVPAAEPAATGVPMDLQGKKILVIDDEADSRLLLTNMLEEFGCTVFTASSGEQGLRLAREQQPQLITVDLLMPKMDGASVIRELKADPQTRDIPLVVVSIVAGERRGSILGAVDMLEKPVARADLLAALKRCLVSPRSKVLIVDDQEDARKILMASLAGEKYEVKTASNGLEALKILDEFPAELVLLDLMMPVLDGVGFLGAFRKDLRYQQTPVIVITSKDLTRAETEELKRQTFEVVKKTELSEERFKQLLRRILKTRTEDR